MTAQYSIDKLRERDVDSALALSTREAWNQTRADWLRLLKYNPSGCFGAWRGEQLIGTVTSTPYGIGLAWIGMMLVDSNHRGHGIGKRLMTAVLEHVTRAGINTIKLDATPAGQPLYRTFGFVPEVLIERWQGTPERLPGSDAILDDLPPAQICAIDFAAYGVSRASMLELLMSESRTTLALDHQEIARGYALVRTGNIANYLGPVIALDSSLAEQLIDDALCPHSGKVILTDFHTGCQFGSEILSRRGFTKQRELTRMRLGADKTITTSAAIISIAGPEIG